MRDELDYQPATSAEDGHAFRRLALSLGRAVFSLYLVPGTIVLWFCGTDLHALWWAPASIPTGLVLEAWLGLDVPSWLPLWLIGVLATLIYWRRTYVVDLIALLFGLCNVSMFVHVHFNGLG